MVAISSLAELGVSRDDVDYHRRMAALARDTASLRSSDPDTQVGCVAVLRDGTVLADANRLPDGVEPLPERLVRPEKYRWRSEEHTSELQSLMRISSAVFC